MQTLMIEEIQNVNGGILAPIAAVVAIITLPKIINDNRNEYSEWGRDLSRQYWDYAYPYDSSSNACYGPNC